MGGCFGGIADLGSISNIVGGLGNIGNMAGAGGNILNKLAPLFGDKYQNPVGLPELSFDTLPRGIPKLLGGRGGLKRGEQVQNIINLIKNIQMRASATPKGGGWGGWSGMNNNFLNNILG